MLNEEESLYLISYFLSEFIDVERTPQDAAARASYRAKNTINKLRKENRRLKNGSGESKIDQVISDLTISMLGKEIDNLKSLLNERTLLHSKKMRNLGASIN